jgi:hypothetical protein
LQNEGRVKKMSIEIIDLREPGAWKKLTRWQRKMASLSDRFGGNTARILEHLAKEKSPEVNPETQEVRK